MKHQIEFQVKLNVDGKDQLATIAADAKALGKGFRQVQKEADGLSGVVKKFVDTSFALSNISSALSNLASATSGFVATYQAQEEAETKLATVMRERMAATEEDIHKMYELARAQQRVGVVGDEVQLAGLQQVATFLKEKESLEKLLPAMNNLLVQQKGLNATQQDAQTIGNLFGKALQGQVNALKRVGISFDEAQANILKTGTELQRVEVISQIVTQNVGDMNTEMAKTNSGKIKQAANDFGDWMEAIGKLLAPYQTGIMLTSQLANIINSAATVLLGFSKTLLAATSSQKLLNFNTKTAIRIVTLFKGTTDATTASIIAESVAVKSLTRALRALEVAAGIGIALAALSVVFEAFGNSVDDAAEKVDDFKSIEDLAAQASAKARTDIDKQAKKLKGLMEAHKDTKGAVRELNDSYGDVFGKFKTAAEWYDVLTKKAKEYARIVGYQTAMQIAQNEIAANEYALQENYNSRNALWAEGKAQKEEVVREVVGFDAVRGITEEKLSRKNVDTDEYKELKKEGSELRKKIGDLQKKVDYYSTKIETSDLKLPTEDGGNTKNKPTTTSSSHTENKAPALEGSLDWYDEKMRKLRAEINASADEATAKALQQEYAKLEKEAKDKKIAIGIEKPDVSKEIKKPLPASEIKTLKELSEARTYYNKQLEEGGEAERKAAKQALNDLEELEKKWNKNLDALKAKPEIGALKSLQDIDDALAYYEEKRKEASLSELEDIERTIAAIKKKQEAYERVGQLLEMQREADRMMALDKKELKIELKAIGFEGFTEKMRELKKMLDDPSLTDSQREQIKGLIGTYRDWQKASVSGMDMFKRGWQDVGSISSGISSLTDALSGQKNAWDALTGVINAFLQIYSGIEALIGFIQIFSKAEEASAVASTTSAAAKTTSAVVSAATTPLEAAAGAVAEEAAIGVKQEAAAYSELAAAKFMAAHADIPFAGFAIGSGFAAASTGIIKAAGEITKFADGGIAFGPTLGLFGEYAGASHNPEVVAPLDKLRSMIEPAQVGYGGPLRLEVSGRKLIAVMANETRVSSRSGRRTAIQI